MYRCNSTSGTPAHGTCVADAKGTQTAGECLAGCRCAAPHNCGQLNGTVQCGALLPGCNVCAACCVAGLAQDTCDACFAYAAPVGCGNQTVGAAAFP
jgi:hypothetical protein